MCIQRVFTLVLHMLTSVLSLVKKSVRCDRTNYAEKSKQMVTCVRFSALGTNCTILLGVLSGPDCVFCACSD